MHARSGRTIDDGLVDYVEQCRRLDVIRRVIPGHAVHTVHYEDLISRPRQVLADVRDFLELDVLEWHLDACADLIRAPDSPSVDWTNEQRRTLDRIFETFPWMGGHDAVR